MQYVYALINFLLLVGIIFLFGRKTIISIFRTRREALNAALDEAEKEVSETEPVLTSANTPSQETLALLAAAEDVKKAADERIRRCESNFDSDCEDLRRTMFTDVRNEFIQDMQRRAGLRMADAQWLEELRRHEEKMARGILALVKLTPGDMVYLLRSEALYVTLTSAQKLEEEIVQTIKEHMDGLLRTVESKMSFRILIDESLIGGFKLRVGDTVYDCTVSNRIYRLGKALTKNQVIVHEADEILSDIEETVHNEPIDVDVYQVGRVISVSDGICWLDGLSDIVYGGVVEFERGERGMILDVEQDRIACIIFGKYEHIESFTKVRRLGVLASVPVGDELLGRVVNPLGKPIDGRGRIWATQRRPIESGSPAILDRKSVSEPMHTGIKAIDALIPIGCGQRELIIGDRQTGKTSIAIDAILSQAGKNTICIYVAIGQKEASVAEIVNKLEKCGAMDYTTIVCATASDSASLQYIAPFAGAAIGEHFMYSGKRALIIYDDLSKHAVAYRELSLLMHRPSGREAYPGDIFYLHARLLERAAQLSDELGGGSMTALPIIETQAGDISTYIPTNVISITDGQIFLETDLFNEGQRPAINVGLSVSRVGSAAQTKLMKQVSSRLRMELAQYRELANFAQFGADLDESTRKVLSSGAHMMAALRQKRYAPLPEWKQALLIYAVAEGFANKVEPKDMEDFEEALCAEFEANQKELVDFLKTGQKLDKQRISALKNALASFTEEA